MSPTVLVSLAAAVMVAVALAAVALRMAARRRKLADRIALATMAPEARRAETDDRLNERLRESRQRVRARTEVMMTWLERFRLHDLTASPELKLKLAAAGWRRSSAAVTFVFARLASCVGIGVFSVLYIPYTLGPRFGLSITTQLTLACIAALLGFRLPDVIVKNTTQRRQQALRGPFPDALDMIVICVESGMSVEAAISRVAEEMVENAPVLAQELEILSAELRFLGDRRTAFVNFGQRMGIESARLLATTLIQAERYGTPVGVALRVLSQENRKERLSLAERKAAALPPKLTIPMIVCFFPGIFVVLLFPPLFQVFQAL